MSGSYEDYIFEQEQRRAALLEMPSQIAELEEQLSKANSVGSRVKGGVIGAILGAIVSKLIG
jgi:hypothetical protein